MILNLIRKDIMIVKGYFFVVIVVAVGVPLLIAWRQPWMGGLVGLLMSVLVASVSFNLAVSEKENKYPKATAFLSSTPYMKNKIIFAKYTIYIIIWLVCCTASFIEMHFVSEIAINDFAQASAIVFLIQSICMGIFLPIQYEFGYEKTKFVCIFLVFLAPFTLTATEYIEIPINIRSFFDSIPVFLTLIFFAFGIFAWFVSFVISEKIFNMKDLI